MRLARSPLATGRVARRVTALQDRLVKELRLAGLSTSTAANQFVETGLPCDTRRVAVPPAQATDRQRPNSTARALDRMRSLQPPRIVWRD